MASQPLQFPASAAPRGRTARLRNDRYRGLHLVVKGAGGSTGAESRRSHTMFQARAIAAQVEGEMTARASRDRQRLVLLRTVQRSNSPSTPPRETPALVLRRVLRTVFRKRRQA